MARDREEMLRAKREGMARRRAADPEGVRAYQRALHASNREKNTATMRAYYGRRFFWGRAMKLRGENRATFKDLARLWKEQRGQCALTGRRLDRTAQLDHVLAKARGGTDEALNLRWLCRAANLARREFSDKEFLSLCSDVMRWIGRRIHLVDSIQEEVEK